MLNCFGIEISPLFKNKKIAFPVEQQWDVMSDKYY